MSVRVTCAAALLAAALFVPNQSGGAAMASDKGMGSDADEAVASWMAAPRGEPAVWLRVLGDAVVRAQRQLGPRVRLAAVVQEPAAGLFRYTPVASGEVQQAARGPTVVPLYVEIEGYSTQRTPEGALRVSLAASAVVTSIDAPMWRGIAVPLGTHAFVARDDVGVTHLALALAVSDAAPGAYNAALDVKDTLSGKHARHDVRFIVRARDP